MPVEVDIASEFRYRNPLVGSGDLVIGISQSGETADTLAAMRIARDSGAQVLAVTNIMGSQATRDADGVLYTRAGLEIGVAATKTFLAQAVVMYLLALRLAELRGTMDRGAAARRDLRGQAPADARRGAARERRCRTVQTDRAKSFTRAEFFMYIGQACRAAGGARGRAEAQGDLLHRDRRVRGGRDEARPDRAARREHAGGRGRDRVARAREGDLEHPGGPGARAHA